MKNDPVASQIIDREIYAANQQALAAHNVADMQAVIQGYEVQTQLIREESGAPDDVDIITWVKHLREANSEMIEILRYVYGRLPSHDTKSIDQILAALAKAENSVTENQR